MFFPRCQSPDSQDNCAQTSVLENSLKPEKFTGYKSGTVFNFNRNGARNAKEILRSAVPLWTAANRQTRPGHNRKSKDRGKGVIIMTPADRQDHNI